MYEIFDEKINIKNERLYVSTRQTCERATRLEAK